MPFSQKSLTSTCDCPALLRLVDCAKKIDKITVVGGGRRRGAEEGGWRSGRGRGEAKLDLHSSTFEPLLGCQDRNYVNKQDRVAVP